jgi:hypothetical protein
MATIASGKPLHFLTILKDVSTSSFGQYPLKLNRNAFLLNNSKDYSFVKGCNSKEDFLFKLDIFQCKIEIFI